MQKSVNISRYERSVISTAARDRFVKTAKYRHPDPDFLLNITKQIVQESWIKLQQNVSKEAMPYLQHVPIAQLVNVISDHEFPSEFPVYDLDDSTDKLIEYKHSLSRDLVLADLEIPESLSHSEGLNTQFVPLVLALNGYARGGFPHQICDLSDNVKEKIIGYNEKMTDTYSEMSSQLSQLMLVINSCKTTKSFESQLPNLVNLYPHSVKGKLQKKNEPEERELTEQEKALAEATKTIAASALFGED